MDTSSALPRLVRDGNVLTVPAFRIAAHAQEYDLPDDVHIDLSACRAGRYRVVVVHNFHVEDNGPDLDVGVAGVFLAGMRSDGGWEEPERFPVECRSLAVLGEVVVP